MKSLLRPGVLVGLLVAALLALTGAGSYGLLRLGSGVLAVAVVVAGIAAVIAVGVVGSLVREAREQLGELLPVLPELPVLPAETPVPAAPDAKQRSFKVREARPGEVPEPYLAAVRKGAQLRQAAWKADAREH